MTCLFPWSLCGGRLIRRLVVMAALALVAVHPLAAGEPQGDENVATTPLDRYIAKKDVAYGWRLLSRKPGEGYTSYVLELTSQSWRTPEEVDRSTWTHWLTIVCPEKVRGDAAFLMIGGGNNNAPPPEEPSQRLVQFAMGSGTPAAEVKMVPNQPLHFHDQPSVGRSEDDLVAYSRMQYIRTRDPEWLVRLPMVKSGVRAMDAVQEFLAARDDGPPVEIERFVVAGASKRGWTTWLVGALDPRVVAIIPIVIDALNTEAITRHQYAAYGFFSPALNDYVRHGLYPDKVGTPEYREILAIEDPYSYRHRPRLRIPKYVVNSAGDQFFTPDNSQFYFHDMPEEKHLRYVPNTKHDLAGSDVPATMLAFYRAVIEDVPRPKITWKRRDQRTVVVTSDTPPREVRLWQATNPKARDFRLDTIGPAYRDTRLRPEADGRYVGQVAAAPKGFTAFFVECTFDGPDGLPLKLTTDVFVVPDVLPFADKAP